jgi:thymidylate synthase
MLAGRNDVRWIQRFNSNIGQFSDDGDTLNGAYGFRWREHWENDQLWWVIEHLRVDPNSRRAVVQMFDPSADQPMSNQKVPKDIPCNTAIYFDIVNGELNMTVTNRSNDMIWGAYGANAVHMSILQEFVANALGVAVGKYVQFSNNFHIYERHFELLECPHEPQHYTQEMVANHVPLTTANNWKHDLVQFEDWCELPDDFYTNRFITNVLNPMLAAWTHYKGKNKVEAFVACDVITDTEIRIACFEWLTRRKWGEV